MRVSELETQLLVLRQAVLALEYGDVGELVIHLADALVGAVVLATVHADRAVHAMHHAHLRAVDRPELLEVEVVRVEEHDPRVRADAIDADLVAKLRPFGAEREQELIAAAVGRLVELVKHDEGAAAPPAFEVGNHDVRAKLSVSR